MDKTRIFNPAIGQISVDFSYLCGTKPWILNRRHSVYPVVFHRYMVMELLASILTAVVALEHLYILYIEMFAWESVGRRVFKGSLPDELFAPTRGLAANQGLYNGFLAAGLIWTFFIGDPQWAFSIRVFFLTCIAVAAAYGAYRSSPTILLKQGVPALLALAAVLWVG